MISSCQTHFAILDKLQGSSLSQKKILRILKIHSKALYAIKTLYNLHLEDNLLFIFSFAEVLFLSIYGLSNSLAFSFYIYNDSNYELYTRQESR